MRNLKRALSLGLTAAMISGLMVMGSSAASYADVTSENNVEAIEVLEAVGIMIGDESGNFNPDQNVTRNEMAVVMANLMEYNVASYKDTSPFTDVPSWAEPYVAACWTNGITAGYSDTIYGGSDTVTTAQAALMLMKALGYFQYASDFGGDWQLATTRQGNAIDLFTGVDSGVEQAMTRNDVAQLVLNTLRSGTVEASTDGSWTIGDVTINNNVRYSYITSNQDYADAIDDVKSTSNTTDANRFVVELGEQLYQGDLELNDNATDVFGRPARTWSYDSKEIGTYAKTELLKQSYTTKVTGRDLYDLLGSNVVDTYDVKVTIDGVTDHSINGAIFNETAINRNNKAGVGATGNGVLTEVYVDQENKNVDIAIINTYLAIATDDYNEKQEDLTLDVYGIEKAARSDEYVKTLTDGENKSAMEVSNEDFFVEDVLDGDVMLVTVADGEIQSISEPETLSAVEISSFKVGDSLTADGTDYDYANTAEYDVDTLEAWTDGDVINLKDLTYNVYLDQYGYAIGVVEVEKPNNYLFITGIDGNYNNLANATYKANAIFLDGTMGTITIDGRKSDFSDPDGVANILTGTPDDATLNRWFTYTVNSSDVYTVDLVDIDAVADLGQSTENRSTVIDYKNYSTYEVSDDNTSHRVYGNDETVYLTASIDDIKTDEHRADVVIDDVDSVAVGIDNVDIQPWNKVTVQNKFAEVADLDNDEVSHGIYTLYDEDGYIIAMVVVGEDNGANDSLVYIHDDSVARESYDKNTEEWTWTRSAVDGLTGEEITLTEVDDSGISLLNHMDRYQWYRVRYNVDGEVVAVGASKTATDLDFDGYNGFENWNLNNDPYKYVTDYDAQPDAINVAINDQGVDTVLYHEGFLADMLSNKGHTLYVSQNDDTGVRYTEDTVVVFEQENDNERTTEFYAGESGVERVINELHDNPNTVAVDADYVISVLFEDGRATTIVVYDGVNDGDDGMWTESNMVTNGNEMFRLWGTNPNATANTYGADAEAIAYNYSNGYVNYSFYVFDDVDGDGDYERLPNTEVTYELRVDSKDDYIGTWTFTDTTNSDGLIDNEFRLANHDEVVDIKVQNVKPANDDEDLVKLTLSGSYATNAEVYAPEKLTANVDGYNSKVYNLTEGDEVIVDFGTGSLNPGDEYEVAPGVVAEAISSTAVEFTITADTTISDVPTAAIITITAHEGITLTDADGNEAEAGESLTVNAGESFTVESQIAGNEYFAIDSTSTYLHGSPATAATTSVTESTDFYAAVYMTFDADVTGTYVRPNGNGTFDMTNGSNHVAVGTEMTLTVRNGSAVIDSTDDVASEAYTTTYTVGLTDGNLKAAWQVNLEGIASVETSAGDTITDGDYVANTETIDASTAEDADGNTVNVLDITRGNTYGDAATTIALSGVSKNVVLSAATKITVTNGSGISVELEDADGNVEIAKDGATETILVLAGERLLIKDNDKAVVAEDVDGNPITLETLGNHPTWAKYTVGSVDITLDDAT